MKLIYCLKCRDLINIFYTKRSCMCGASWGYYMPDGLNAEVGGKVVAIGIANSDFGVAVREQPEGGFWGKEFRAWTCPKICGTIKTVKKEDLKSKKEREKIENEYFKYWREKDVKKPRRKKTRRTKK